MGWKIEAPNLQPNAFERPYHPLPLKSFFAEFPLISEKHLKSDLYIWRFSSLDLLGCPFDGACFGKPWRQKTFEKLSKKNHWVVILMVPTSTLRVTLSAKVITLGRHSCQNRHNPSIPWQLCLCTTLKLSTCFWQHFNHLAFCVKGECWAEWAPG